MSILPELSALQTLLKYCHRRRYPSKTCIFRPGDRSDTLHCILEGSVSVTMPEKSLRKAGEPSSGSGNQDVVLTYVCRGDFLGVVGFFLGETNYEVSIITREPTVFASISYARLRELLKTTLANHAVEILGVFGTYLSKRLTQSDRKTASMAVLDVSDRIAQILLELSGQPDAMSHPDGTQIRVTRQELGRLVGCSREMAGRVLKDLEHQKRISAKGKTIVVFGTR
jgi:CRP/FNR family transcriptional regulator, cyclic AMP receptor protein